MAKNKKIIIFGASTLGISAFEFLNNEYYIKYYVDNDSRKWGNLLNGILITSVNILYKNNYDIIIASIYHRQIANQLIDLNIDVNRIYIYNENKLLQKFKISKEDFPENHNNNKNIVFFCSDIFSQDIFLNHVIEGLSQDYNVKKVLVGNDYSVISKGIKWADICWFEWCDRLLVYSSNNFNFNNKKVVVRIHGYEVYGNEIFTVNWKIINKIIIVAPHIQRIFIKKLESRVKKQNIEMIFCGIDIEKYNFKKKTKGYNLGFNGFFNYKKNIPLLLSIFNKLHHIDERFTLHLAGKFEDERIEEFVRYYTRKHTLEKYIKYYGWVQQEKMCDFYNNINYIVIPSIDEGICYAAAEAMCTGVKPILHNCEGLSDHYKEEYIFNDVDEAVSMIIEEKYESFEYRKYIEDNYSMYKEISHIKKVLISLG